MKRFRLVLETIPLAAWAGLLFVPGWFVADRANTWDTHRWQLLGVTAWFTAAALVILPRRLMLVATGLIALAGIVVVAADRAAHADVLELASVWYTFSTGEVKRSLAPYAVSLAGAAALLLALGVWAWRSGTIRVTPAVRLAVAVAGVAMALALPAAAWRAAWPVALGTAIAEGATGDIGIGAGDTADIRSSPRTGDDWGAKRSAAAAAPETYVLIIGESIRSDRIPGCGGRAEITPPPAGSITFCDVLAGAGSTHVSVPLLVSRDAPGTRDRIPRDSTVLRAFEAAGFDTYWLAVQHRSIAWPDARSQAYEPTPKLDRDALLPLLDAALARPGARKAIVVHAYNAHLPYADRYIASRAPFHVDRSRIHTGQPAREAMAEWWNDYDNAVDETMRFVADVVGRASRGGGEVVVLFTPDHAENMLDDARGLTAHALKQPTWWDTHVPLFVWASDSWRSSHAQQWSVLATNRGAPLMHMDVVPTWLGMAGIRYAERRPLAVDLSARPVPSRARWAAVRPGEIETEAQLRREAGLTR